MTAGDYVMHALGVLSLVVIAAAGGFAVLTIVETVVPSLGKIRAALAPVLVTLFPVDEVEA